MMKIQGSTPVNIQKNIRQRIIKAFKNMPNVITDEIMSMVSKTILLLSVNRLALF